MNFCSAASNFAEKKKAMFCGFLLLLGLARLKKNKVKKEMIFQTMACFEVFKGKKAKNLKKKTQKFCHFNSLSPSIESSNTTQTTPHFFLGGGSKKAIPSLKTPAKFGEISKQKNQEASWNNLPHQKSKKKKKLSKFWPLLKNEGCGFKATKKPACRFFSRQGPWVFTPIF